MGIPVGARGVETDAELDTVSQFGFNFAQGGLLGGAMTTTELAAFKTSRAPLTKRRAAEF
jgi:EAL domain-containing protein (putative c-di-GMP-specific phosphodiesterase class I)